VCFEPVLKALDKAKRDGKARFFFFLAFRRTRMSPSDPGLPWRPSSTTVVLTSYNFKQDHHLEVQKAIGEAAQVASASWP